MRLWRIAQRKHALDKLCAGAAQFGGRWNPIGVPALYAGTSIAMTALEKLLHVGAAPLPPLVLVAIDMPAGVTIYAPGLSALPIGWDAMPTSGAAQIFGGAWLARGAELAMKVPSVIIHEEANVILNPHHPDYAKVKLTIIRPFTYDARLFK